MKLKELRKMTKTELTSRLTEKKQELRDLEFDIRVGQAQDYAGKSKIRKEVARILTAINNGFFAKEEQKAEEQKSAPAKTSKKSGKSDKIIKLVKSKAKPVKKAKK
jgi:ribosomal protein L29